MRQAKLISIVIIFLVCTQVFAVGDRFVFDTKAQQQDFDLILKELRCVTCPNQNIADSYAPVAKAMQEDVYVRIKRGESLEDIRAYLLAHYGDYVFYKPTMKKENMFLWFGPFLMLVMGGVVWFRFSRKL